MAYKVYKEGNYILIENLDNNSLTDYPSVNVRFDKSTLNGNTFSAYFDKEIFTAFKDVSIDDIQMKDGTVYTVNQFNVWSRENTGVQNEDFWIRKAINEIFATYGDIVSVDQKNKSLLKFGRNQLVSTSKTTLAKMPVGIDNETFVSSNLITQISSSSGSDTGDVTIEGHTSDDGLNFTFVTQTVTMTGQTAVVLGTPLCRVSRVVNNAASDLVGNLYVAQTDSLTAGVPQTDLKVHLIVSAGLNNSEKAATTISNNDYYIFTSFYADCLEKTSAFGIVHLEIRESGKTFINKIDIEASTNIEAMHPFKPYLIAPKNSDVRIRVSASANDKDFSGGFEGVLCSVIS